ncbi:unnamed protein product [Camellia sinensis]
MSVMGGGIRQRLYGNDKIGMAILKKKKERVKVEREKVGGCVNWEMFRAVEEESEKEGSTAMAMDRWSQRQRGRQRGCETDRRGHDAKDDQRPQYFP